MSELMDVLNEWGEYTNQTASRKECCEKGLWHKESVAFIVNSEGNKILLQQRSNEKRRWPGLWDVSVGGHVDAGELGYQAIIREIKEEIGFNVKKEDLEFIGVSTCEAGKPGSIHKHYNEIFVVRLDVKPEDLKFQKSEVQGAKWFTKEEFLEKVNNNYEGMTTKKECWNHIINYFKIIEK